VRDLVGERLGATDGRACAFDLLDQLEQPFELAALHARELIAAYSVHRRVTLGRWTGT
jgi:hypothetical protein